jgi:hypothetical protein
MRQKPSKSPSSNTITVAMKFQYMKFGKTQTLNIWQAQRWFPFIDSVACCTRWLSFPQLFFGLLLSPGMILLKNKIEDNIQGFIIWMCKLCIRQCRGSGSYGIPHECYSLKLSTEYLAWIYVVLLHRSHSQIYPASSLTFSSEKSWS